MKNGWKIYSKDMRNITRNWVAAMLIGGLIILPSLYAWFNIKASWDPYGQTDQIPIGVVNKDAGGQIRDEKINAGNDLVNTLKNNDSMDWHFTNREKAMESLKYGDYFAVIVIPEDFSDNLSTVITDNPKKSKMEYYVNEKINAISPKITDKGASTIVEQISSNFISTVNGVIFDMFDEIGVELNQKLPDIKKFEDYVFTMEKKLPEIHDLVSNGLQDTKDAQSIINKAQNMLPEAERTTNEGIQTVNETADLMSKAEGRLNEMAPKMEEDLKKAQGTAEDINKLLKDAQNVNIDFNKGQELQQSIDSSLEDATSRIGEIEAKLKQVKEMNQEQQTGGGEHGNDQNSDEGSTGQENNNQNNSPNSSANQNQVIDNAMERLSKLRGALEEAQKNGQNITTFIEDKNQEIDSVITDLEELSGNTANRIGDFLKDYKENIEPIVKQKINNAQQTLSDAKGTLSEIKSTIPEVRQVLSNTENHIGEGQDMLNTILDEYPYVNSKINELAGKIRDIQGETDINEIIELLQNDPEAERNFFEEPVKLSKNELFPIPNYGSGMTPFYTVLAIWVGGLLLISLLAADIHGGEDLTGRERYIGKLFTFLTIGLLQTLVVTLGDWFIVDAYMAHPVWFVIFGLLISLVFMMIIFTLVSLFGDVGKAMVIVLLVLQIAGAGGTYPVVLLPELFQAINPFLPFTYAIDLMREAVGGIIWKSAIYDMAILGLFGLGFLLFGILLKNVVNKYTDKLMKKSKDAGLFH
ncbi:YhgE/Pip domain-containing protein [Lentibacillus salicampi]|uniref:YhgE/Pip domain-containing protein n=1 Tax=Lentibacillus salicampi TaxID=175306 RepID=A0A4Y9ABR3_9BACI|nr:YhgE/Pip domain-containing protein [Lentibacillus salicampi]TFJ93349.1 YhgE/Pip domain-containing protein [Lentibacillus salicampi]